MRLFLFLFLLVGCSSKYLKYDKEDKFFKNEEFERQVKIQTDADEAKAKEKAAEAEQAQTTRVNSAASATVEAKSSKNETAKKPVVKTKKGKAVKVNTKREPDIEDSEGFAEGSRRPSVDPFKVGEKVIHAVKYFTAEAGKLTMQVKPMAQVNNRPSYHFVVGLKSSSLFSSFYSVEDQVDTYLDYENLMPYVLKINIKETGKLAQVQSYFDQKNLKASFWEKKYTEKSGEEEKKSSWDIAPFSQNAFSGFYYMRIFTWKVGKEISFRVAEDEKNVIFKGTAIAKETLETEAGTFSAYKIKASITSRGALSQTGDIFIWISDDDRKYILRIEAKIKIGTLVSEVVEIEPGK